MSEPMSPPLCHELREWAIEESQNGNIDKANSNDSVSLMGKYTLLKIVS